MVWWQILLIVLATIVAGVLIGLALMYLERRKSQLRDRGVAVQKWLKNTSSSIKRSRQDRGISRIPLNPCKTGTTLPGEVRSESTIPAKKYEPAAVAKEVGGSTATRKPEGYIPFRAQLKNGLRETRIDVLQPTKELRGIPPELLVEVKGNLNIAVTPWTGRLLPFHTRAWDALPDHPDNIPASVHQSLSEIYIDIRLANSIVQLSTDFNRRSPTLDQSYKKLCVSIAERLSKLSP